MKLSLKQILASAAGATLAAVIASLFGVKGTMIGVAIGSALATTTTALVAQSIERGHNVVKQAVVQAPKPSELLRRFGQTQSAGAVTHEETEAPTLAVENATGIDTDETAAVTDPGLDTIGQPQAERTRPVPAGALASGDRGEDADSDEGGARWPLRWPVLLGTIAGVFVLALVAVTSIELIAGKPLSAIFGSDPHGTGTSFGQTFVPSPAPPTTTAPISTSTTAPATTTSTTSSGTATSGGTSTTTTSTTAPTSTTSVKNQTTTPSTSTTTTSTTAPAAGVTTTTTVPTG
jgi:hypothetical protein